MLPLARLALWRYEWGGGRRFLHDRTITELVDVINSNVDSGC
jgi:hypothetical protein